MSHNNRVNTWFDRVPVPPSTFKPMAIDKALPERGVQILFDRCSGIGENAGRGRGRGRRKNFPGMGLAHKRAYDSDEAEEPRPRFFSSRMKQGSGLD